MLRGRFRYEWFRPPPPKKRPFGDSWRWGERSADLSMKLLASGRVERFRQKESRGNRPLVVAADTGLMSGEGVSPAMIGGRSIQRPEQAAKQSSGVNKRAATISTNNVQDPTSGAVWRLVLDFKEQTESQRTQQAVVSASSRCPANIVLPNFASLSLRATELSSRNMRVAPMRGRAGAQTTPHFGSDNQVWRLIIVQGFRDPWSPCQVDNRLPPILSREEQSRLQ